MIRKTQMVPALVITALVATSAPREAEAAGPACVLKTVMAFGTAADTVLKAYQVYEDCFGNNRAARTCTTASLSLGISLISLLAAGLDAYCNCGGQNAMCALVGVLPAPAAGGAGPGPAVVPPVRRK